VWRADLDQARDELLELLSAEEQARASRLPSARNQRRWARSRGVLRALLGLYLGTDPAVLRFRTGEQGKPSLEPPEISFSLSHSAAVALYAVTPTAAVGIDVELAQRSVDELAIARRILEPAVATRLEALPPAERSREFLSSWARHEARVKRLGIGIGSPLPPATQPAWCTDLDLDAGAGALAVEPQPSELRCWSWPPSEATGKNPG
jgi:4'-phosphopantetheinyl transferase